MFVFVMISQLIIKGRGACGGGWSSTSAHPLDIASTGLRAGEIDELCRGNVGGGGAGTGENGRVQGGGGGGVGLFSRILPIGSTASSSSSSSSTANGIMADEAKLLDQRPCFAFVPRRRVPSTLEPPPSGGENGSWRKTKAKPFATAGLASVDHFLGPLFFKDRVGYHRSVSLFQANVSPRSAVKTILRKPLGRTADTPALDWVLMPSIGGNFDTHTDPFVGNFPTHPSHQAAASILAVSRMISIMVRASRQLLTIFQVGSVLRTPFPIFLMCFILIAHFTSHLCAIGIDEEGAWTLDLMTNKVKEISREVRSELPKTLDWAAKPKVDRNIDQIGADQMKDFFFMLQSHAPYPAALSVGISGNILAVSLAVQLSRIILQGGGMIINLLPVFSVCFTWAACSTCHVVAHGYDEEGAPALELMMNNICDAVCVLPMIFVRVKHPSDPGNLNQGVSQLKEVLQSLVLYASVLFLTMSTIILVINCASLRKWILVQGGRRMTMHPTIVLAYFAPVVYYASQLDTLRYDEEGATAFERAMIGLEGPHEATHKFTASLECAPPEYWSDRNLDHNVERVEDFVLSLKVHRVVLFFIISVMIWIVVGASRQVTTIIQGRRRKMMMSFPRLCSVAFFMCMMCVASISVIGVEAQNPTPANIPTNSRPIQLSHLPRTTSKLKSLRHTSRSKSKKPKTSKRPTTVPPSITVTVTTSATLAIKTKSVSASQIFFRRHFRRLDVFNAFEEVLNTTIFQLLKQSNTLITGRTLKEVNIKSANIDDQKLVVVFDIIVEEECTQDCASQVEGTTLDDSIKQMLNKTFESGNFVKTLQSVTNAAIAADPTYDVTFLSVVDKLNATAAIVNATTFVTVTASKLPSRTPSSKPTTDNKPVTATPTTHKPVTAKPTSTPTTDKPVTARPTSMPTTKPVTTKPTSTLTSRTPTGGPTFSPEESTVEPTNWPSYNWPTFNPTELPTVGPSLLPTFSPTVTYSPSANTSYCFTNSKKLKSTLNKYKVQNCSADFKCKTREKYGEIGTWCTTGITDMSTLFQDYRGFNDNISGWDVSNVTNMFSMFSGARQFNQPLDGWNVSKVKNMAQMFRAARTFNQPLVRWNVGSVSNMSGMFNWSDSFNQPLDQWNVGSMIDMNSMFRGAKRFNQPLDGWNVGSVTNMTRMFSWASGFDQPLNKWNVGSVTNMNRMFSWASNFNQPLNGWNISKVTTVRGMFANATRFNQPLDGWNVGSVTDMGFMFYLTDRFNQPLNSWNVSTVTNMAGMFGKSRFNQTLNGWDMSSVSTVTTMNGWGMFADAKRFNQPLDRWNVSSMTDMKFMFSGATSFNQPLNRWNVSKVTNMEGMFSIAWKFNQPLNGWNVGRVQYVNHMFFGAISFNQSLRDWNIGSVYTMEYLFYNASKFNQDLCSWGNYSMFPYGNVTGMFEQSNCTYTFFPNETVKGPFCASVCNTNLTILKTPTEPIIFLREKDRCPVQCDEKPGEELSRLAVCQRC